MYIKELKDIKMNWQVIRLHCFKTLDANFLWQMIFDMIVLFLLTIWPCKNCTHCIFYTNTVLYSQSTFGFLLFNTRDWFPVSVRLMYPLKIKERQKAEVVVRVLKKEMRTRGQFCFSNPVKFLAADEATSAKMTYSHMGCVHVLYTNGCPLYCVLHSLKGTVHKKCVA